MKQHKEEYDKWKKQQDKNKEKGNPYQAEYPKKPLDARIKIGSQIAPDEIQYLFCRRQWLSAIHRKYIFTNE